jgi:hypothetical protein
MIIRPNKRTYKHLEQLASYSNYSMARTAMVLLREYVNAQHHLKVT